MLDIPKGNPGLIYGQPAASSITEPIISVKLLGNKYTALLLCSLTAACTAKADFVVPENPQNAALTAARWQKTIKARFDLPALREFLRKTIAENKQLDGVDLTHSRLDPKWRSRGGSALFCGDWIFSLAEDSDNFEFQYIYDNPKYLRLKCARLANDSFRMLGTSRDEIVSVHDLPPAKMVRVIVDFTVGADGTPQKISFVEPYEKKYEESVLAAIAQWKLPKEYVGKRVRQPIEFAETSTLPPH